MPTHSLIFAYVTYLFLYVTITQNTKRYFILSEILVTRNYNTMNRQMETNTLVRTITVTVNLGIKRNFDVCAGLATTAMAGLVNVAL